MDQATSRRDFLGALAALSLTNVELSAADQPRELQPTGANLGSLFPEVEKLAAANRYELSFLGDRFKDLGNFKKTAREKLFEVLLYRPEPVDPKPEVVEKVDEGDYVREKVLFNTSPQFRIAAYVLVPKNLKKPAPAIVDLHSHGGMFLFGKEKVVHLGKETHAAMGPYHERNYDGRPTANEFARRGYVVISIDAFMFGERRILMDVDLKYGYDRAKYSLDDVKYLNGKCRGKEDTIVKGLCYAGLTWPGIVFWDDIRTVDYLVTRPEVDPKRIGCLGISMGGWRTAFLAGLDERIEVSALPLPFGLPTPIRAPTTPSRSSPSAYRMESSVSCPLSASTRSARRSPTRCGSPSTGRLESRRSRTSRFASSGSRARR